MSHCAALPNEVAMSLCKKTAAQIQWKRPTSNEIDFISKNPSTHYLMFLYSLRHFLGDYVSQLNFLQFVYRCHIAMTPSYWWHYNIVLFHRSVLWRLCHIEDSAVLMSLPYSHGDDSAVLRILPYCSASCVLCSSLFYERQWHLISIEKFSLALDRCPF